MDIEEFFSRLDAGENDFSGVDLSGAVLNEVDLSGINLSGADLRVTRMEGINFENANLLEVNWYGAQMYGAYFYNTVMPDGELVTEPNSYG